MDSRTNPVPSRRDKRGPPWSVSRPLWAAPLFVAGVAALVWVCVARPFFNRPEGQPARDLAAARLLLERPDGDALEADGLVRRALEHPEYLAGRGGEAKFLLGWAEARRARQASKDKAGALWSDALRDLDEAEKQGVADDDLQKLTYQLGKVGFYTNDEPRRVVDRLAGSADAAEDRAEAYDLLTQAYLRLPEPDLQGALDANLKLRGVAVDDQLAEAQLLGGDLLLRLGKPTDALSVLSRINSPASPALVLKARCLRARILQDNGKWAAAAGLWQSVLAEKKESAARAGMILYYLGLCYQHLDQPAEAAKFWELSLAKPGDGDEVPACALALADLTLRDGNTDKALALFARAVEKTAAQPWTNSLIDRAKAVETFERSATLLRQSAHYEAALNLAESYEHLAGPVKANVLRGDVLFELARAEEKQSLQESSKITPASPKAESSAEHYRHSGAAYVAASAAVPDAATKANYLWVGMQRFLAGQDRAKAIAAFDQLQQVEPQSVHLGEAWYLLGEAHRRTQDLKAAEAAYLESIKYPTPFAYRSRYQVAMFQWERGEADNAAAALEQNLKALRFDRDDEAQEKSLFAIGNLSYKRGDYTMASRRLEEALERFPDNAEAVKARFNLALSFQQMADQKNFNILLKSFSNPETVEHYVQENRRLLQRAADEFEKLIPMLEKPEAASQLAVEDQIRVPFRAADCRYYAGQYRESLLLYEKLAELYAKKYKTPEEQKDYLLALGGCVRCLTVLISPNTKYRERLRQRVAEIQMVLQEVDEKTRQEWDEWLKAPKKIAAEQ
jgi:tetratricopeptide (TPR) repeat protein